MTFEAPSDVFVTLQKRQIKREGWRKNMECDWCASHSHQREERTGRRVVKKKLGVTIPTPKGRTEKPTTTKIKNEKNPTGRNISLCKIE
jgi:hypothetical protein